MNEPYVDSEMEKCTKKCNCKTCADLLACQCRNMWDCGKCMECGWGASTTCKHFVAINEGKDVGKNKYNNWTVEEWDKFDITEEMFKLAKDNPENPEIAYLMGKRREKWKRLSKLEGMSEKDFITADKFIKSCCDEFEGRVIDINSGSTTYDKMEQGPELKYNTETQVFTFKGLEITASEAIFLCNMMAETLLKHAVASPDEWRFIVGTCPAE